MKIQVLYFEGCPNYKPAIDLVRSLAASATIEEIEIKTQKDAVRMRFLGSPTILVDGVDVEPSAWARTNFGFTCRTYGGSGLPSRELVTAAMERCSTQAPVGRGSSWIAGSSVVVAAIASACCWLPLALLAFGMSAVGFSSTFEGLRPWLFAATAILLAAGFYSAYRSQPCCTPTSRRFSRTMVWVATAVVLAFAMFPLYADALTEFVGERACCTSPETDTSTKQTALSEPATSLTVLSDDAHELKEAFNADKAAAKVMLIVSPKCPACRDGATVVQEEALAHADGEQLKIYVVWINRYPGDSRKSAQEATELVSDKRAQHFWDGSGALGKQYGKIVKLPGDKKFAWDVYFVFGPNAKWADTPRTPDFWMHQLGGPETGNLLDGKIFREAIVKLLPKRVEP